VAITLRGSTSIDLSNLKVQSSFCGVAVISITRLYEGHIYLKGQARQMRRVPVSIIGLSSLKKNCWWFLGHEYCDVSRIVISCTCGYSKSESCD
jgi:hypothetical protein